MKKEIELIKVSALEKTIINMLSPIESVLDCIPYVHIGGAKSLNIIENRYKTKIRDYRRLIYSLERFGYHEAITAPYMKCPNGRIQLKLAEKRNLIPKYAYKELKQKYHYNMRVDVI